MYACTASPAEASDSAAVTLRIRILLPPSLSIAGVDELASTSGFRELRWSFRVKKSSADLTKGKQEKLTHDAML